MKNKYGMVAIVYFMMGVLFFLLGLALAPSLVDTVGKVRTDINCTNSSISNQDKAVCYQVDTFPPLFVGLLFGFGGIILTRLMG